MRRKDLFSYVSAITIISLLPPIFGYSMELEGERWLICLFIREIHKIDEVFACLEHFQLLTATNFRTKERMLLKPR